MLSIHLQEKAPRNQAEVVDSTYDQTIQINFTFVFQNHLYFKIYIFYF